MGKDQAFLGGMDEEPGIAAAFGARRRGGQHRRLDSQSAQGSGQHFEKTLGAVAEVLNS